MVKGRAVVLRSSLIALIHQSAWKDNSPHFASTEFSEVGLEPPWVSSLVVLSGSSGKAGREGGEPMPVAHLNDTELFYVEVGEGLPCLVMHGGLGFDHSALHPWLDPLGDVMRLVYYDHRGNGRSGRPPSQTITFE